MPAVQPQPVLAPSTPAAIFPVATVNDGDETVDDAWPEISGPVRAIGFRDPTKRLSAITSIGSAAGDRLFPGPRPTGCVVVPATTQVTRRCQWVELSRDGATASTGAARAAGITAGEWLLAARVASLAGPT